MFNNKLSTVMKNALLFLSMFMSGLVFGQLPASFTSQKASTALKNAKNSLQADRQTQNAKFILASQELTQAMQKVDAELLKDQSGMYGQLKKDVADLNKLAVGSAKISKSVCYEHKIQWVYANRTQ